MYKMKGKKHKLEEECRNELNRDILTIFSENVHCRSAVVVHRRWDIVGSLLIGSLYIVVHM